MDDLSHSRNLAVRPRAGFFYDLLILPGLIISLGLAGVTAQTSLFEAANFTRLHSFTGKDGAYANGLILSSNTLYGTTPNGGSWENGTVFKLSLNGTGFSTLHNFASGSTNSLGIWTNSDGAYPSGLITLGNILYGTARNGGSSGYGTVFAVKTDGTGFTNLYSFTDSGAWAPNGLILWGNTLYGTANGGGSSSNGIVFAVNTDGTSLTHLHDFAPTSTNSSGYYTNNDGAYPNGLALSGDTLYGIAARGGSSGLGTVFAVKTNGAGFTNLHSLSFADGGSPSGLIVRSNILYGSSRSTVFAVRTDGTGFTNLLDFWNGFEFQQLGVSQLTLSGDRLYGVQSGARIIQRPSYDTVIDIGYLFAVKMDGTDYADLYSLLGPGCIDCGINFTTPFGVFGDAPLILAGKTLYGTTEGLRPLSDDIVFSLSFSPQLTTIPSAGNFILTWPTNYAGFDYTGYTLQYTTNLGSSANWTTNLSAPVVVNGQNTVTNSISGTQQFFRLSQ